MRFLNLKNRYKYNSKWTYPGRFSEWLSHDEDSDQKILEICVTDGTDHVAKAYFGYLTESRGGRLCCLEIFVEAEFRRKGIATKIYDLAESLYYDKCEPYPGNSSDAKMFWEKRKRN